MEAKLHDQAPVGQKNVGGRGMTNSEFRIPECRMTCGKEGMDAGDLWVSRLFRLLKTGKLTGEAAGQGEWQLTGF